MAPMPHLLKKITLARSVFAMVNGRDKKHQPHDERENLKRCEIKQLPNCWPENLSRYPISPRFSFPFPPSPASPFVSRNASVRFSPVLAKSRNLAGSSVPRDSRASFSLNLSQLAATSPTRPRTPLHAPPFLHPLPFFYSLCSARDTFLKGSDSTRYDGDVCRKPTAGLSGGSLSVRCRSADPISNWVRSVSKYRTNYVPL